MSLEHWLAFVAASAVLLFIPGPTILTVISYSVSHGQRAKLPLVAAVALGDSTSLVVSLLGLGALLATSAFWFTAVKWVGGLYLIHLGIKLLRAGIASAELAAPAAPGSRWRHGQCQPVCGVRVVGAPPAGVDPGAAALQCHRRPAAVVCRHLGLAGQAGGLTGPARPRRRGPHPCVGHDATIRRY